MAQGSEWWLITVPVEKISKDRPDDAFEQLKVSTASLASKLERPCIVKDETGKLHVNRIPC